MSHSFSWAWLLCMICQSIYPEVQPALPALVSHCIIGGRAWEHADTWCLERTWVEFKRPRVAVLAPSTLDLLLLVSFNWGWYWSWSRIYTLESRTWVEFTKPRVANHRILLMLSILNSIFHWRKVKQMHSLLFVNMHASSRSEHLRTHLKHREYKSNKYNQCAWVEFKRQQLVAHK